MLAERSQIRVYPHSAAHVAPQQLHDAAAAAAEVEDAAAGCESLANERFEFIAARAPLGMLATVALAIAVLAVKGQHVRAATSYTLPGHPPRRHSCRGHSCGKFCLTRH